MGVWIFDPTHTQVEFAARHLGMMTVRGHFSDVTVTGDLDPDHPERSQIDVTVRTASIRTHHEKRDADLRNSYFLDVEHFPTITFHSTRAITTGADTYDLTGDLTIKGVTKPVTLKVTRYGEFTDPQMGHRIGYGAQASINRKDYGMTFEMMLDGRFVVANEVQLTIEGELLETADPAPAG
jgi:polyisoprenoid-binding protein YceI